MTMSSSLLNNYQTGYSALAVLTAFIAIIVASFVMPLFRSKLDVNGKHCYVTGGSQGLGKAVAVELVKRGAHVTIVARGQGKLDEALAEMKAHASPSQTLQTVSADLTTAESSADALERASKAHNGECPDQYYLCAGSSKPRLIVEMDGEEMKWGMDQAYWVQAFTALAAVKQMVTQRKQGKIVFVSSILGMVGLAGWTGYAPGKYAVRGLADTLRSEMLLHGISIHIFIPTGIDSPGYLEECKTKPAITTKLEDGDVPLSPESCAKSLLSGVDRGYYQITNVLGTDLVRMTAKGPAPGNNIFLDSVYWLVARPAAAVWTMLCDGKVRAARKDVEDDLTKKGFFAR